MKFKMNKKIAIVMAILILTMSIGSAVFAASGYKDLKAWYNNIKIFKNGQPAQLDFEPFIIDGYTYVPLRAVGELFNKDFDWDGVNYTINIKDRPGQDLNALMTQVINQQVTISTLEAKVKSLESELEDKTSVSNLSDMEKQLNKDHGTYEKIKFDIRLYGTKDKPEARIYVDLYDYSSRWDSLSSNKIKGYLQDIVDDIRYEFKNARVSGFIEDSYRDKELVNFSTSSNGTVSVSTKSSGLGSGYYSYALEDLEDFLNVYYDYYERESANFSYELKEGNDYIEAIIYVDEWDWDRFSSPTTFLDEIGYEIYTDFPSYSIYLEVRDSGYSNRYLDSIQYQ